MPPNEIEAPRLCDYYLNQNLSGSFICSPDLSKGEDAVNQRIVEASDKAGMTIVLLDRDICDLGSWPCEPLPTSQHKD
jgi:hypothetical protein